ncbi:uncharacterized protein CIMG_13535 [Coccidioides immitis RS]|uniref:Uncharacterized protein n=1 Tax=Coccidioides immitis (strain RS) TaxID=246410 RepID=J3K0Q1_COCIM|nr:uncharacterized protein CIMG_13535 [Coccidioides immitis RS]EAS27443.3 hypothetical protein CIMG_13535 [Coccidioides immitis RS]
MRSASLTIGEHKREIGDHLYARSTMIFILWIVRQMGRAVFSVEKTGRAVRFASFSVRLLSLERIGGPVDSRSEMLISKFRDGCLVSVGHQTPEDYAAVAGKTDPPRLATF